MKIIFLGDIHGRTIWKKIVEKEKDADKFVFIGDYFDSFDIYGPDQVKNFIEIMNFVKNSGKEVITLIGNHDYHYFKEVPIGARCSGFQHSFYKNIEAVIEEYRDKLQIAYNHENILCTHAGVSQEFIDAEFPKFNLETSLETPDLGEHIADSLIHIWTCDKRVFIFNGIDNYGNDTWQTPIWIRPYSLMKSSTEIQSKGVIQIVGHTGVLQITLDDELRGYFFIDCLEHKQYLIYNNGKFSVGKV